MPELGNLDELRLLHGDLLRQTEQRLPNIERLCILLDSRIDEFRNLLDKAPRSEKSRESVNSGKITINEEEFSINEVFRQGALNLADTLNLDELQAAQLFFASQDDTEELNLPLLDCAIIRFYQTQKYLLDCLRLVIQLSLKISDADPDVEFEKYTTEENTRLYLQATVHRILNVEDNSTNGQKYLEKCLQGMKDIASALQNLLEKINSANVVGRSNQTQRDETIEYQRVSLIGQHELLGVIVFHLIKAKYSQPQLFDQILQTLRKADKYDNLLVHYIPAVTACINAYGSPEGAESRTQASSFHQKVLDTQGSKTWNLQYLQGAITAYWLADYSGWYHADATDSPLEALRQEEKETASHFSHSLKDGAFDFFVAVAADVKSSAWQDPNRQGLRLYFQKKVPFLGSDAISFSGYFQEALLGQLQAFVDVFIDNLPSVLRSLKLDEEGPTPEHHGELERFLIIISYVFDGRPDAAWQFWSDPDSNFTGFLQWASRRASTPLVSAFCEMLQAITGDERCATAAHRFLTEEGSSLGRMRRSHCLTWAQIFRELHYFTAMLINQPALSQPSARTSKDAIESDPESGVMLETYLRLITRLCTESAEARDYLLGTANFKLIETLFQLTGSSIDSTLRACAFIALRSLLTQKSPEVTDTIWHALDQWTSGIYAPGYNQIRPSMNAAPSNVTREGIFRKIAANFEEPNAFVQLLTALMSPSDSSRSLNDTLPFPENLGSIALANGIDVYIDFVLKDIFCMKTQEFGDAAAKQRLMSLSCLEFIYTCLSTFNEDLVIFANRSNVVVDTAMRTTNLAAYVRLHPFSRVMEWLFNERIMHALFSCLHQDLEEVNKSSSPDTPLITTLLCAIRVITLALDLQPTYLDIVKPLIRAQNPQRSIVANAAYVSFEDGILNHLATVVDLGLYCGTGIAELTSASLNLLQKLSSSPSFVAVQAGRGIDRNKIIAAFEAQDYGQLVARYLDNELTSEIDIFEGSQSVPYRVKMQILDFLMSCIVAVPSRPSVAHLFLGFDCKAEHLDILPKSAFARDVALFQSIMRLAIDCPLEDQDSDIAPWLTNLKSKALQVLRMLWMSPLSSAIVLADLANHDFMTALWFGQTIIRPQTKWQLRDEQHTSFGSFDLPPDFTDFLIQRAVVFQYIAAELRRADQLGFQSACREMCATLLGTSNVDGVTVQSQTIFDMFDFIVLDPPEAVTPPSDYFIDLDFSVCLLTGPDEPAIYDAARVQSLLLLRLHEYENSGRFRTEDDGSTFNYEALNLLQYVQAKNDETRLAAARIETLKAWTQVIMMIVVTGQLQGTNHLKFITDAIVVVQSRLERHATQDLEETQLLASLAKFLLFKIDINSKSFKNDDTGHHANERLYQLFSISLRAIQSPTTSSLLRETFYTICYRYLSTVSQFADRSSKARKHTLQTVKACGEGLLATICDDAYAGEVNCRVAALMLLTVFEDIAQLEGQKYISEALIRVNFLSLVVDSLKSILDDLNSLSKENFDRFLQYMHTKLAFLLQFSRTRSGATAILGAGFMQTIKESRIFSVDPDVGLEMQDSDTLRKYFDLLIALMRVIIACVSSRGQQNEQTLTQAKKFISDNRLTILTIFKRSAGIGSPVDEKLQMSIEDLADAYMMLMTLSRFLDGQEEPSSGPKTFKSFT